MSAGVLAMAVPAGAVAGASRGDLAERTGASLNSLLGEEISQGTGAGPPDGHDHSPENDFKPHGGASGQAKAGKPAHSHGGGSHTHSEGEQDPRRAGVSDAAAPRSHEPGSDTLGHTTLEHTIQGGDPAAGFQQLSLGPGEARVVREELATAQSGREGRRVSMLYVGHLTDFQVSDEESPSRVEFVDATADPPFPNALSAAWRPQEALVAHGAELGIRQVNRYTDASPHSQGGGLPPARMDATLMTGDLADNQQFNETEWVVRLLEGGPLDPSSGIGDFSGCPGGIGPLNPRLADPRNYAGVQDKRNYPLGVAGGLNQFYDPNDPGGIWSGWPVYPSLMDRAQEPFVATGLRYGNGSGVPSYVAFGNHDALAQGNQKTIAPFEIVGIGCIKPLVQVLSLPNLAGGLPPTLDIGGLDPTQLMIVPPDPARRYVDKAQFKEVHDTGFQADAHGFTHVDPAEEAASDGAAGYYAFDLRGFRMIGLDTLCEGGVAGLSSNGNIDHPQWQWLTAELDAAQAAGKVIVVFGHHPVRSLSCPLPDETPPPCLIDDGHGHDLNPGCDRDPRDSAPIHMGGELAGLLSLYPNVITYIAGHTHEQSLADFSPPSGPNGFWGIETASLIDWPPQSRLLEVMDNCDGTLSILGTVIDTAAPATAPPSDDPATPADEANVGGLGLDELASISRTLSYNDPQAGPGTGGQGTAEERNVELLLDDPRPARSAACAAANGGGGGGGDGGDAANTAPDRGGDGRGKPGDDDGGGGDGGGDGGGGAAADAVGGSGSGSLPFTGFGLFAMLIAALALLAAGLTTRARRNG